MLSVIIVNIWGGTAFAMLIFLGALRTIPTQIQEAARVDGARAWQRFWDHTLPNLRAVAVLVLLSVTISTFGTFIMIQTLTNGGPGIQTETISLYAYHTAFRSYEDRLRFDDRRRHAGDQPRLRPLLSPRLAPEGLIHEHAADTVGRSPRKRRADYTARVDR